MTNIFSLNQADYAIIDNRMKPFLAGWSAIEQYKGVEVKFPGTWNSSIHAYKYFEVIKKPGDPNYKPSEEENEIGLCLWAGWKQNDNKAASDDEIDIRLFIVGRNVLSESTKVSAEIHKLAGAPIKLYYKNKLVTDFTKSGWIKTQVDKVWIDDMRKFL